MISGTAKLKWIIVSLGACFLFSCASGEQRVRLPPPFKKWAPDTTRERQLDRLITRASDLLDKAPEDNIDKKITDIPELILLIEPPRMPIGKKFGSNYFYRSSKLGTYFHWDIVHKDLPLFVPSVCRQTIDSERSGRPIPLDWDYFGNFSAHPTDGEIHSHMSMFYEIKCQKNQSIRLYFNKSDRNEVETISGILIRSN